MTNGQRNGPASAVRPPDPAWWREWGHYYPTSSGRYRRLETLLARRRSLTKPHMVICSWLTLATASATDHVQLYTKNT
eukprot:COSAG01_NODE_13194_length_1621_cov_564.188568_1_plen_78_part_00